MTNYLAKSGKRFLRITIGAFIATLIIPFYIYFPDSIFQSVWMKAAYSLLIILCTFGYNNVQRFIKHIGLFYFTTFATGGGMIAIHYMFQPVISKPLENSFWYVTNLNQEQFHIALFGLGFPFILIFLKKVLDRQVKDKINYDQLYPVWVEIDGKKERTMGYIDSGNQLSDPITNRPVVVCDTDFLKRLFSLEDWQAIELSVLNDEITAFPENIQHRISVIPYQGVGGEAGYLYTIRPDRLGMEYEGETIATNQVLIGIQLGSLTSDLSYHCLLQPALIQLNMMYTA